MNFTNITAANTTLDMINAINIDFTGGILGIMLLLVLVVVVFLNLSYNETKDTFLFTSFFAAIVAGLMWLIGLIGEWIFVICCVMLSIAIILAILTGDR